MPRDPGLGEKKASLQASHPKAGIASLCLLILNVLLLLYSHLGVSADILSNLSPSKYQELLGNGPDIPAGTIFRPLRGYCPSPSGSGSGCGAADLQNLFSSGNSTYLEEQIYEPCGADCGIKMINSDKTVGVSCFSACAVKNFSSSCADCMGERAVCVAQNCLSKCIGAATSLACLTCAKCTCEEQFVQCSGFPMCFPANDTGVKAFCEATAAPTAVPQALQPTMAPTDGPPDAVLDDGTQLWSVPDEGEISFSNSISRSWEGGAKNIAIVIVILSGIWPYSKALLLIFAWFVPLRATTRNKLLQTVTWFGRWSMLDVFAVLFLVLAIRFILLEDTSVPVKLLTHSRLAIVSFNVSALLAVIQGEWMLNKSLSSTNYSAYTKAVSQDESCLSQLRVSLGKPVFMVPICIICFVGHLFSAIGTAGTFSINDPTSTKPPQIFELVLATILNGEDEGGSLGFPTDNRYGYTIDFVLCFFTALLIPLFVLVFAAASSFEIFPGRGLFWLTACGKFCCLDVFCATGLILFAEFGPLIESLAKRIRSDYDIKVAVTYGSGIYIAIPTSLLFLVIMWVVEKKHFVFHGAQKNLQNSTEEPAAVEMSNA